MAEFINTIDALGDDVVVDSIINRTITEFKDNVLTILGYEAFRKCNALKTVDLPSLTHTAGGEFALCDALVFVDLPELQEVGGYMFYNSQSIQSIVFPKATTVEISAFYKCIALETVDLYAVETFKKAEAFARCAALTRVIIRNTETIATLENTNTFVETPIASGTGYIYVPRALVDSYKAATNWSTYAAQFRALEDYTVDGTTTGALDETKI